MTEAYRVCLKSYAEPVRYMIINYNFCLLNHLMCFFLQVKNWVKELRKMLGNEISLCIVGNKTDLEKERNVTAEEAEE